ncbi:hypothetical protein D9M72_308270 [compost metagenome]
MVDVGRQLLAIRLQVLDRARGHAGLFSGLGHRRRDLLDQALVERRRDDVVGAELQFAATVGSSNGIVQLGFGQLGDRLHAGQLHRFRDLGRAAIERAAEDIREAQHVVDLVRVVRTAGRDDAVRARGLGHFRADFRLGVGQRQDDGLVGHGLDHLGGQHAGGRATQEDVGVLDDVSQRARRGVLCVARLVGFHVGVAANVDHALGVHHRDVLALHAEADHGVQAGNGSRAGAGHGQLHLADVLADHLQAIEQRRSRNNGGAVLVVMEDGDVHALAQLLLDVEAFRRLDVFQVHAAQRGFQRGDDLDDLVRVARVELDVEHVDAGELLEQAALALHHRLAGQRADVAQPQHGGAVGHHGHQVGTRGVFGGGGGILGDFLAGVGDARRVGQRQVALVGQRLGRGDLDLSLGGTAVVFQCSEAQLRFRTVRGMLRCITAFLAAHWLVRKMARTGSAPLPPRTGSAPIEKSQDTGRQRRTTPGSETGDSGRQAGKIEQPF